MKCGEDFPLLGKLRRPYYSAALSQPPHKLRRQDCGRHNEDGSKMALIHRTKTTHCYSATAQHFQQFFSTLTQMYEEQAHTDVHLVSSDGTVFGVHRVGSTFFACKRPHVLPTFCHAIRPCFHNINTCFLADGPRGTQCLSTQPNSTRRTLRMQHTYHHPSRFQQQNYQKSTRSSIHRWVPLS